MRMGQVNLSRNHAGQTRRFARLVEQKWENMVRARPGAAGNYHGGGAGTIFWSPAVVRGDTLEILYHRGYAVLPARRISDPDAPIQFGLRLALAERPRTIARRHRYP